LKTRRRIEKPVIFTHSHRKDFTVKSSPDLTSVLTSSVVSTSLTAMVKLQALVALALTLLAASSSALPAPSVRQSGSKTILATVLASTSDGKGGSFDTNSSNFDILAHLVILASLQPELSDKSAKLTVFAPTDGAFMSTARDLGVTFTDEKSALDGIAQKMSSAAPVGETSLPAVVKSVLLYHVAGKILSSTAVLAAKEIDTLSLAPPITRNMTEPLVLMDQATNMIDPQLIKSALDIKASNGVIHSINRVLLPVDPATGMILTGAIAAEESAEPSAEPSIDASANPKSKNDSSCFPASAIVHLDDGMDIAMHELTAGTAIKVGADDLTRSSKVYLFSHKIHTGMHDFVRITSVDGHAVTLSANHYMYANGKLTAASAVKAGDALRTLDGASTVAAVHAVRELGLFAPHTLHGDLVVNRVVVSSYTRTVHPRLAHALLAPVRAVVRLGLSAEPLGRMMYEGGGRLADLSSILGGSERL
jgi:uncharacterized surface protein with fasciclin (FAS1) repeats